MNIISKKTYLFVKDDIVQEPTLMEGMQRVQKIEDTYTAVKSDEPQTVPDWVKHTDLFKMGLKDESIIETVKHAPDDPEMEKEKEKEKERLKAGAAGLPKHQPGWNR